MNNFSPSEMNRLSPKDFGSIINTIEYQKEYLFRITLPEVDTKQYMGKLNPQPDIFEVCTSSTTIPSLITASQNIGFYNSELKISTKTTYSNWSATFKLDANRQTVIGGPKGMMNTWEYFYVWQLMANWPYAKNSAAASFTSALPKDYKKDIELYLLNEFADEKHPTAHYKLESVSPVAISGGNLAYANDGILNYNVEFALDRFIVQDF